MTFIEKYKALQDRKYLIEMITKSVYDTMSLEDQKLSMAKIKELVKQSLSDSGTSQLKAS